MDRNEILFPDLIHCKKVAVVGEKISLTCAIPGKPGRVLVGEERDSFLVAQQLVATLQSDQSEHVGQEGPVKYVTRVGYCELYHAVWISRRTKPCEHRCRIEDEVPLDTGCVALAGFKLSHFEEPLGKPTITLTAGNSTARWLALLGILKGQGPDIDYCPVMLRGDDCCLRCAIDQTTKLQGTWWLVL